MPTADAVRCRSILVAVSLATLVGCTVRRADQSESRRATAVGEAVDTPRLIDADVASDSAYSRCLRRADGTSRPYDEVEPHVAAHPGAPSMLLAGWMVQGAGRGHPMRTAVSLDGGRSWERHATVPFGPCGWSDPDFPSSSDPWVAIDPVGRMYVGAVVFRTVGGRQVSAGIAVSVSTDTGRTWGRPQLPIAERSPRYFNDNVAIAAHPRVPGTAYLLTTRFEPSDSARPDTAAMSRRVRVAPAVVSVTRDGGRSWSAPVAISPRHRGAWAGAPQLTVDARTGTLWVVYTTRSNDTLQVKLVRSTDDARSWSSPVHVVTYHALRDQISYPGTQRELGVAADLVHLAVDTTREQLWVAFTDGRHSDGRVAQVSVTGSGDAGRTWSTPVRANGDSSASWRPTVAVSPRGGVVVAYLTPGEQGRPNAPADSLTFPVRVEGRRLTLASPRDASVHPSLVLDRFGWRSTVTDEHFLGDYFGMVTGPAQVLVYSRSTAAGARVHAVRFTPP